MNILVINGHKYYPFSEGRLNRTLFEEIIAIVQPDNEVKTTIIENNSQGEKIIKAAESFERLNENMGQLIDNVAVINSQIEDLSDSNNKIVENISQLSAVTEEVTASAEQVLEKSNHNLEYAETLVAAIFTMPSLKCFCSLDDTVIPTNGINIR